jgi:hypothetical protein
MKVPKSFEDELLLHGELAKLRADNKALLDENTRLKGEIAMAETALGIKRRLEQSVTNQ